MWLGLCLGIAPVGAWIAVTGKMGFPSMVLSAGVISGLRGSTSYTLCRMSISTARWACSLFRRRIGTPWALAVSRVFHAVMVGMLVWFGLLTGRGIVYYAGVGLVALFLLWEQSLVSPRDLSRVNTAFFTLNGCVSLMILGFVAVDVFL